MANLDRTRTPLISSAHYVRAGAQQGRTLLDSDWNEDVRLTGEDLRMTFVDLLGCQGSTNAGFSIGPVSLGVTVTLPDQSELTTYDFGIGAGSVFVGGLRWVADEADAERFLSQLDWLQVDADPLNLPPSPTLLELVKPPLDGFGNATWTEGLASTARYDMVYLEAWEQPVTAVEDSELRERALGGPDAGGRIRRVRRVKVRAAMASADPSEAFEAIKTSLINDFAGNEEVTVGSFDDDSGELVSNATLTVLPITDPGDQPCGPAPASGYTGHEDQAIRVELRGPRSMVWGFANASPLYRVQVSPGGAITMLNRPRDTHAQPLAGQIVEFIGWGSKLPNGEKLAELTGHLARVKSSYQPGTGEFTIEGSPPPDLVNWHQDASNHWSDRDPSAVYLYARVWSRGSDDQSLPIIEFGDDPVPLGNTGLQVRLGGAGVSGDYWIIAARRATPAKPVPWALLSSCPPHGPRRFYSPLALIGFEAPLREMTQADKDDEDASEILALPKAKGAQGDNTWAVFGPITAKVFDARRTLTPLCVNDCVTVTVGDVNNSQGMVNTLQEAFDLLPSSGGKILLLPGDHKAERTLVGRSDITICGCDLNSRLVNVATVATDLTNIYQQGAPLLTLQDCENIVFRDLVFASESAVGVKLENVGGATNRDVRFEGVRFEMTGQYDDVQGDDYALPQAAILALGCDGLTIENCAIHVEDRLSYVPALVLGGANIRVANSLIQAGDPDVATISSSMGGLQILSFSTKVEIVGNTIRGGWGFGVGLGHLINVANAASLDIVDGDTSWSSLDRMLGDALSNLFDMVIHPSEVTATPLVGEVWVPAGPVVDIRICDNRVLGMGLTGISAGGFVDTTDGAGMRFLGVINAEIHRNEIIGNLQRVDVTSPRMENCDVAVGGLTLAMALNLDIRENHIVDNGADVQTPTCGIAVLGGQGVVIQENVIVDNGPEYESSNTFLTTDALRGGVVFCEVTPLRGYNYHDVPNAIVTVTLTPPPYTLPAPGGAALTMRRNEIRQRAGKALWVFYGYGAMIITENSLQSLGDPTRSTLAISNSQLHYNHVIENPNNASDFGMNARGATVELRNYGYSPNVTYAANEIPETVFTDTVGVTIEGGEIDFSANEVNLSWYYLGGYPASVILSSLDTVKVTNNVMVAHMKNQVSHTLGSAPPLGGPFLNDLLAGFPNDSFVMVNCWAGASSVVQVAGNRFEEGPFDCMFSLLAGHAAALASSDHTAEITKNTHGVLSAMNVGSHCLVVCEPLPAASVRADEIVIYEVVSSCARTGALITSGGSQEVWIQPPSI